MFKNIQLLRGIAALLVVLFHGNSLIDAAGAGTLNKILRFGYVGVDIFFVISGFVAIHTSRALARGPDAARWYLIKRCLRIYLGYWPIYALSIAVALMIKAPEFDSWNLLSSFFLVFLLGAGDGRTLVSYVAWSLTYEIIFYVFVSLSLLVRNQGHADRCFFIAAIAFVPFFFLKSDANFALLLLCTFLSEFAFGAVLRIFLEPITRRTNPWMLLAFAIGFLSLGIRYDEHLVLWRTATFGAFGAALIAALVILEVRKTFVAPAFLVRLGDASYTLYLIHPVVLMAYGYFNVVERLRGMGASLAIPAMVAAFAVIVLLARLLYVWVERPVFRSTIGFFARWAPRRQSMATP